jgi:hypothetical protein
MQLFNVPVYTWCCGALREWGAADREAVCCLYAMLTADMEYREAVAAYAKHRHLSAELINSRICYSLLAAGVDVHPETLFRYLKWRGEEEIEN